MGMFFNEDINTLFVGGSAVSAAYAGSEQVWPVGLPSGTVFNFEYTGNVQSVELPRGKYKLQCWGAQGGTSSGSSSGAGSKGGYSEGVLTLTEKTTLYIFVGGQGSRGSSTSLVNGGWNGGGASVGYSSYNSGDTNGYSYPACGGGATDISTVTSSMNYSNGRTNRSAASLLARCIVAGGGAGGSYRYTTITTTSTSNKTVRFTQYSQDTANNITYVSCGMATGASGKSVTFSCPTTYNRSIILYGTNGSEVGRNFGNGSWTTTAPSNFAYASIVFSGLLDKSSATTSTLSYTESTTSTSNSSGYSNQSQQGGGTSGRGQYPGTQTSAGSGGAFGLGANQSVTNYRYCGGGGGGGWYGGGTSQSDSSTSYVSYSGGGSGFVNTSANASSRPSGYTGLQLDSGTTKAGNTSFQSVNGGSETGHSGNGYARITVL
jgi:hypothetical protein